MNDKLTEPEGLIAKIHFSNAITYVGGYRLGKNDTNYLQINLEHKPNWFHRQCMKIFFGIYWVDIKQ